MGLNKRNSENVFGLTFILQSFEGTYAVLQNSDPEIGIIKWPIKKLPDNIQAGDKITIKIEDSEEQYTLKRRLLEELVN